MIHLTIYPRQRFFRDTGNRWIYSARLHNFNWNLSQDPGEPSATEDVVNEVYNFEEIDFASINNFTLECAKLRPRIAEIPVGAVDADRGIVESPFELYFFHGTAIVTLVTTSNKFS